jgi:hypothetical protein
MAAMILGQREWSCVEASRDGAHISEQWCLKGELPSRSRLLLSRARDVGPYLAPASAYPDVMANIVAERSFVRPALQILKASETAALWLLALSPDVLMGDSWELRLVHQANQVTTNCLVEVFGPAPRELDQTLVELLVSLVSAPDGVLEPAAGPSLSEVESTAEAVFAAAGSTPIENWLETLETVLQSAEALAPSLEANFCLGKLATLMSNFPGAPFLGLSEESVRLNRIILRRTPRQAHAGLWALAIRDGLLSLADVSSADEITDLITACRAAIAKPNLIPLEQAVLHHCEGELFLRTNNYEAATLAFSQSREGAAQMGKAGIFHLHRAELGLAKAYKALGRRSDEVEALNKALPLAEVSQRAEIQGRLDKLKQQSQSNTDEAWRKESWVKEAEQLLADEGNEVQARRKGRVLLKSPYRTASPFSTLILRPLVTANSSWLPNRFSNPLKHAWRFRVEPPTLTFEETLSRALGHRCSFTSKGGEEEGFGIGRFLSLPSEETAHPDRWKNLVEVMVSDSLLTDVVIVYPADSLGMQWELDLLQQSPSERQVRIFMVPPALLDDGLTRWQAAQKALSSRGMEIPKWHADGLIFRCGADGKIKWSDTFAFLWDGRFASWLEDVVGLEQLLRQKP